MMEQILTIVTLVITSGTLGTIVFFNARRRKENADADRAEGENMSAYAKEWRELAEKREVQLDKKELKIDNLYKEIGEARRREAEKEREIARLKVVEESFKLKNCDRRACEYRKPQTGY